MDAVFREDYLNCFTQVSRSWRVPVGLPGALLNALAGDFGLAKGVRVTVPISLEDDDYIPLAASFIARTLLVELATGHAVVDSKKGCFPDRPKGLHLFRPRPLGLCPR